MRKTLASWLRNERGAVAPIVALSLFGLIAAGGIAFDYARLATMDTELQQAADQAALAAAGQLDRTDTAQARAIAAINGAAATRLAANTTRFSNDNLGAGVEFTAANITFCSDFDDSEPDATACTATTVSADSRFVMVTTTARTANYAFTPIVAAFSGTSSARAVAGVESSICHIAPLFVCTDDANFPSDSDIGRGLVLKTGAQNSWFPGNYGYLQFGNGNGGVIDALLGDGLNGCQPIDETNTQPGNKNATDAINTRFDVYDGVGATKDPGICTDLASGNSCPDQNTGKDLTMLMTYEIEQASTATPPARPTCGMPATGKSGNPNPSISYDDFVLNGAAKGMPRDTCHYSTAGCADANFGDKVWNYAGYMAANHPSTPLGNVPRAGTTPTRHEVYGWELANRNNADVTTRTLQPFEIGSPAPEIDVKGNKTTYTYKLQCMFRQPRVAIGAAEQGRRILPIVAANCAGLNGQSNLDSFEALRVFNVFLTEPSMQRTVPGVTDDKEIYGEVIGPATTPESGTGFQYYSRNKPYLVR